jgi:dCTP deaminase
MGLHSNVVGVLTPQGIREAIHERWIDIPYSPDIEKRIQPAGIDSVITEHCIRVPYGFRPPLGKTIKEALDDIPRRNKKEYDCSDGLIIKPGFSWLCMLEGTYTIPPGFWLKSSPKSTQGRLGNFVRLIGDNIPDYNEMHGSFQGKLAVVIAPSVFYSEIFPGISFTQLRFFYGAETPLTYEHLKREYNKHTLVFRGKKPVPTENINLKKGVPLTLNLEGINGIVGYKARKTDEPINLRAKREIPYEHFFEEIPTPKNGRLLVHPQDNLLILYTREKVRVPPHLAAELAEYDTKGGEIRFHAAGFFDPGFGHGADGKVKGSSAVLEVFSKEDEEFPLVHGGATSKLVYEWMRDIPDKIYGPKIDSTYRDQLGPMLPKQFKLPSDLEKAQRA